MNHRPLALLRSKHLHWSPRSAQNAQPCPASDWFSLAPSRKCCDPSSRAFRLVQLVSGQAHAVPSFPHAETATLDFICDEQVIPLDCFPYSDYRTSVSSTYWADSGETYYMGMQERREAVRSAQIDAGGVTVAFAPLADGSDFTAAYCEIPYTKIILLWTSIHIIALFCHRRLFLSMQRKRSRFCSATLFIPALMVIKVFFIFSLNSHASGS